MTRRLVMVNLALSAAVGVGLWRFRVEYRQAQQRYRVLQSVTPVASPAPLPAPPAPPVRPGGYLEAAEKFLFSPDRNPTVVVEPPKAKPRPTLPQLFGVMNLGGGPIAIMSAGSNARHKSVRVGESIGDFKLLAAAPDTITLEWEGEKIEAQVSDLLARPASPSDSSGGSFGGAAPPTAAGGPGATVLNPGATPTRPGEYVIGPAMQGASGTIYQSLPGDTAPHGTVFQGKRKVVRTTPFGQQAWWEDVKP